MKKIKLLTIFYVLFFMVFFTTAVFAQNSVDLNGNFEGTRKQYNSAHTDFIQEFQYTYNLKQDGDIVTGTSTIINEKGDYAVTQLKGYVVGNIFYFEEYQIEDEMKDPYSVWCFKKGALNIVSENGKISLEGDTESYTSNYGRACTGGFTQISKIDSRYANSNNDKPNKLHNLDLNISVAPNPTVNEVQIRFENNAKQQALIEIFDLNGKKIAEIVNGSLEKGQHQFSFSLNAYSNGLYIVKLTLGSTVHSTSVIKADR